MPKLTKEEKAQKFLKKQSTAVQQPKRKVDTPKKGGYDSIIEQDWIDVWKGEFSNFVPSDEKKTFMMCIPPPNITGSLHIGHAMMISIQDAISRFKRLNGHNTLFLPGTDHAGIATQSLIMKRYKPDNYETFMELANKWADDKKSNILNQFDRMGTSLNYDYLRFTLDPSIIKAVHKAFVTLYEKGLIYREARIVNWCAKLKTTISDLEVNYKNIEGNSYMEADGGKYKFGNLYYVKYRLTNLKSKNMPYCIIATTRPETILGDTAICVNPNDPRFKDIDAMFAIDNDNIDTLCDMAAIRAQNLSNTDSKQIEDDVDVLEEIKRERKNKYKNNKESSGVVHERRGIYAINPLTKRLIPVVFDELADLNFGTGIVKITPAHDPNDFSIGKKHNLPIVEIMDEDNNIIFDNLELSEDSKTSNNKEFESSINNSMSCNASENLQSQSLTCSLESLCMCECNANVSIKHKNDCITNLSINTLKSKLLGLKRFEARKTTIEILGEDLVDIQAYDQILPICSRSGDIVEPLLKDQWWCDCDGMAKKTKSGIEKGEIKMYPLGSEKLLFGWLDGIRNWCLSRQLWWGHSIPAYYCSNDKTGEWIVSETKEEAVRLMREKGYTKIKQDTDVLDTWFSSALWPFATIGWPDSMEKSLFPNSLLETGLDILFFWVARMMMLSYELLDMPPFKEVLLHGIVRDAHGQKMSKSLGNVIDPLYIIEGVSLEKMIENLGMGNLDKRELVRATQALKKDYPYGIPKSGSDALRFTLLSYTNGLKDINLDINRVGGYSRLCNKLYNSLKFVLLKTTKLEETTQFDSLAPHQKWLIQKRNEVIRDQNKYLNVYNFMSMTQNIHQFFLYDFCDVFLELCKQPEENDLSLLRSVFEDILKIFSPMMPFITEELNYLLRCENINETKDIELMKKYMIKDYPEIIEGDFANEFDKILELAKDIRAGKKVCVDECKDRYIRTLTKNSSNITYKKELDNSVELCGLRYSEEN